VALQVDPERNEVHALARVASWRGKRTLEIGCGAGRLTVRLARLGARVEAIDPNGKLLRCARRSLPVRHGHRVRFRVAGALRLPFQAGSFERVVFSWSL
jgi:ubiquinone/menaquinone biosynthesis C-methylase UbiE